MFSAMHTHFIAPHPARNLGWRYAGTSPLHIGISGTSSIWCSIAKIYAIGHEGSPSERLVGVFAEILAGKSLQ